MAQAKAQILGLVNNATAGGEVEITRHSRVVARLAPAASADTLSGRFASTARSVEDDETLFNTSAAWVLD